MSRAIFNSARYIVLKFGLIIEILALRLMAFVSSYERFVFSRSPQERLRSGMDRASFYTFLVLILTLVLLRMGQDVGRKVTNEYKL